MKKFIPAIVAIALIIIVLLGSFAVKFVQKYSYSKEQQDLKEYYHIEDDSDVAIVLQNEIIDTKAKLLENTYYLDFDSVQTLLNDRFYVDSNENLLIYTTPTDIIKNEIGSSLFSISGQEEDSGYIISRYEGETLYVALDYVKKYTNFSYTPFSEPNRIQLRTEWGERTNARVKKDSAVRLKGGVKSPVLRNVKQGESLVILEEMENWTKVKTDDALIGYIENKHLEKQMTEQEIAVTDYVEPEYTSIHKDYKINMGWHQVMAQSANGDFDNVVNGTGTMNIISPTWFSLIDNEGNISSIASSDYVNKAHARNMEVWALIDNFNTDISTYEILSYTSKRAFLIQNIMSQLLNNNIDGINVDFEQLDGQTGEHFTEFIRELSIECRKNNIVLSIDNYVPRESTSHYNRKEQGVVADYVIIMGYDEHWSSGGVAGSVASIGFVEDGITATLEEVPADKIINGIPFYTRVWKTKGNEVTAESVGMETAEKFVKENHVETRWDEETCQNYGEIQLGDTLYQVWLEDEQSIETKLSIMSKYDLAGVAEWKLGFEKPSIWKVLDSYVK